MLQSDVLRMRAQSQRETLADLSEQHSKLKEEIDSYKKQAQEMETDIHERKGESTDQHKYEILFSKDQEMSQFIEGFDEAKKEEEEQMQQKQRRIVQLLTETSKMIKRGDKLPDKQHVMEMEDQLEFKGTELKNAEVTAVRLRTELDRRSGELDKINSLDNKITTELQQLDTKMKQFKYDIENKYNRVDRAKEDGEQMLRQLDVRRDSMMEKVKVMKLQVTAKKLQYDTIKQQLADNETHKALEAQEGKLRQIQKSVLYLSTYCASKSGESDYSGMQRNVLDLVESV